MAAEIRRLTIGLLIEGIAGRGGYHSVLWTGAADAAWEQGVNLLCFTGGELRDLNASKTRENIIYNLAAKSDMLDGLIIGGSLTSYISDTDFQLFLDRYRSRRNLPMVTIAVPQSGIPGVLVGNKQGVRDTITHLVEDHQCRKIAFIQGPKDNFEAHQRYLAYEEELTERNLPLFSSTHVDFFPQLAGEKAIHDLLPIVMPDAIIAANDNLALGALKTLQAQGIRVPDDIILVGFDDIEEARAVTPSLTTVRQPLYEQGKRAVELLLAVIRGERGPEAVTLPTVLVKRQSCGCLEPEVVQARIQSVVKRNQTIEEALSVEREGLFSKAASAVGVDSTPVFQGWLRQLLDALSKELKGITPGAFLAALNEILHRVAEEEGDVAAWQGAVSVLRGAITECADAEKVSAQVEDIWHQARVTIAKMAQQIQAHRKLETEQQATALRDIEKKLITTVKIQDVMDILAQELSKIDIPSCYISLYEQRSRDTSDHGDPPGLARLVLGYVDGKRLDLAADEKVFSSSLLIPDGILGHEKNRCIVVEPLCFREKQLGFALFEIGPREGIVYEALREQISGALFSALFVQEVRQGREYLQSLYQASGSIISLQEPKAVLKDAVEKVTITLSLCGADVVLIDRDGRLQRLRKNDSLSVANLAGWHAISLEVMSGKAPFLCEDLSQQSNLQIIEEAVSAAACFPFPVRGEAVGVMWIYYREPHLFSEAEVNALSFYINQVAIAYDNAKHMSELEHLRLAVENLASAAGVKEVLRQIARSAYEVLQADSVVIWPYDSGFQRFLPDELVTEGIEPNLIEDYRENKPRHGGTTEQVLLREYVTVTDVDDPKYSYLGPPPQGLRKVVGVKSFQGIALKVEGDTLGVLYVSYGYRRGFNDEDKSVLEAFARHAALALNKARLLERVEKAHKTTAVVAKASIQENLRDTLDAIAEGIRDVLKSDAVTLYVYNESTAQLAHPPSLAGVNYPERAKLFGVVQKGSVVYKMLRRDTPYVVETTSEDRFFKGRRFTKAEKIQSCTAIPLKVAGKPVGVMFVNYRTHHHFTDEELSDIQFFANQAAVAIRNAQLFDDISRKAKALQAIYEAGKAVTGTLALDQILVRLVEQAQRITGNHGKQALLTYIALIEENKLRVEAALPVEHLPAIREKLGTIDLTSSEHIGIMGKAVKSRRSILAGNVLRNSDYIEYNSETRSELAVPIRVGGKVVGIINVEHSDFDAFNKEDQQSLEFLAAQAAIAIQNAWNYKELRQIKGLVGSRTILAWIGMASGNWRHSIDKHALTIREQTDLLRKDLVRLLSPENVIQIEERLSMLQRLANLILEKPITPPLSAEEGVFSISVNELIQERTKRLWQSSQYKSAELQLNLTLSDQATVRVSSEWLRRALDILIDNAIGAMTDSSCRQLTIVTRQQGNQAEIMIIDTGKGIPEKISKELFHRPIKKRKGAKGLGIGLLMAEAIIETYGGKIGVHSTGPTGTAMYIRLPLEA